MAEYLRPDVYVQREKSGAEPIQAVGTSTGAFVGTAQRGKVGTPTFVTSWTDYVNQFARGLSTPFVKSSDLAYAVYGFFQNGGGRAYIVRTATEECACAKVTQSTSGPTFTAKDEGTWANKLEIKVTANEDILTLYDFSIKLDGVEVEQFKALSKDPDHEDFYVDYINDASNYITVKLGSTELAVTSGDLKLTGGNDGTTPLPADYIGERGLQAFNTVEEINLVAVPGQTSKDVVQGVVDYCSGRGNCFAVLDAPLGATTTSALEFKKSLGGNFGALYYPWGKVVDPIGKGKQRLVPPSGHIMGVYARTDNERGVHKAPAGVEAQVKGFVDMERPLANGDVDLLNSTGVNCIVSKPNKGIVCWGARILTAHNDRFYVSDMRFDIALEQSLYKGTQWAVFEPNDHTLWGTITAQIKAFLYNQWVDGALFGSTPEEAYFVKCDEELNPQEIRDAGKLIVEIGYAKKKPAEFVILKLTQKTSTN